MVKNKHRSIDAINDLVRTSTTSRRGAHLERKLARTALRRLPFLLAASKPQTTTFAVIEAAA